MKILTVPFAVEGFGKGQGAKNAPKEILKVLDSFFSNERGMQISRREVVTVPVDVSNIAETNERITEAVKREQPTVILGGDHSITYACVKGFVHNNPGCGFVVFDAHPDCENNFNPPTQEDYLITLIEEGVLDPSKVILIGIRNSDRQELDYLKQKKVRLHTMNDIYLHGWQELITGVMETIRSWPSCYVSVDIDVCDPAFAPGTGWIEPGGISSRELIFSLQRLALLPQVKTFDIVEVDPARDVNEMTVQLAAKIVTELSK